MALSDDLKAQVTRLFQADWNVVAGRVVPTTDSTLTFKNDGARINATVLYADLADSTILVDSKPDWFAAEIYKAFLACAGKLVLEEGGEITAYDGDRIMAVFIGDAQHDRAVRAAQKINWAVKCLIQPALNSYRDERFRGYTLKHVVGIDTSQLLVARIGVRSNSDLVWVGRAANYAAKLASEDDAYAIYITGDVYLTMTNRVRLQAGHLQDLWAPVASTKIPPGYAYRSNSWWPIDAAP